MGGKEKVILGVLAMLIGAVVLIVAMNLLGTAACRSAGLKAGESAIDVKEMCR